MHYTNIFALHGRLVSCSDVGVSKIGHAQNGNLGQSAAAPKYVYIMDHVAKRHFRIFVPNWYSVSQLPIPSDTPQ